MGNLDTDLFKTFINYYIGPNTCTNCNIADNRGLNEANATFTVTEYRSDQVGGDNKDMIHSSAVFV